MRIRCIKPEFWRSDDIDALDWDTRLVFVGLWSYVDDNGVGIYKMSNIVSDLFASDFYRNPTATLSRVSEALQRLESRSMIDLYRVGDRDYLYITNWERHQRVNNPNKPRYPLPTSENSEPAEALSRSDVEPRETVSPGTGEQRSRGTGEQGKELARPSGPSVSRFDEFWSIYPRKVGKQTAVSKYKAAVKRAGDEQTVIDGAQRLASDPNLPEQKYIPHPKTWLERDGWEDEPLPSASGRGNTNDTRSTPKGYDPADWLRPSNEPGYIDAEVVQLREIGR